MAPHSSTLAWKIPWAEEPGRLQSMVLRRVGHEWAISLSLFTLMHWRRKWQPTPVFLPGESQGRQWLLGCCLWGCTESDTTEATWQQQQHAVDSSPLLLLWHSPSVQHNFILSRHHLSDWKYVHNSSLILANLPAIPCPPPPCCSVFLPHHQISRKKSSSSSLLPLRCHSHIDPLKFGSHHIPFYWWCDEDSNTQTKVRKTLGFRQGLW